MSEQIDAAKQTVTKAFANVAEKTQDVLGTKSSQVILIAFLCACVLAVIGYFVYRKLTTDYVNQSNYIIDSTREGRPLNRLTVSGDASEIPSLTTNGQRATFTFWVYIHNLSNPGQVSYVFRRGSSATSLDASPCAFFDKKTPNKLHVRIPKADSIVATELTAPSGLPANSVLMKRVEGNMVPVDDTDYIQGYQDEVYGEDEELLPETNDAVKKLRICSGITVPYIPIQRWVHVAIVVNEQSNGGTITAYVDAEQVNQILNAGTNFRLNTTGEVYLGSDELGLEGLVSYLTFWNYDLNIVDIYNDYRKGPIRSLLAKLGLGAYGVQSPIYKIKSVAA